MSNLPLGAAVFSFLFLFVELLLPKDKIEREVLKICYIFLEIENIYHQEMEKP